jgi:MoxR-like ATPase
MIKLQNLTIDNRPSKYLPSPGLLNALEVAYMLKRPLLLTGEPGTGKTQFAFWVADQLAKSNGFQPQPFIYNTKTSSTAKDLFYHYDAIAHFRETRTSSGTPSGEPDHGAADNFIQLKAMGLAIAAAVGRKNLTLSPSIINRGDIPDEGCGSVVLIDEIDKASRDFPNDLLNEIENYEFEITELNQKVQLTADSQRQNIIVILTSNFEKTSPTPSSAGVSIIISISLTAIGCSKLSSGGWISQPTTTKISRDASTISSSSSNFRISANGPPPPNASTGSASCRMTNYSANPSSSWAS